jgi:hypothetical protein
MSPSPQPKRRKILISLTALCLVVLVFIPLPLSITAKDKNRAVSHALTTLLQNRRVLSDEGYAHLVDTEFVKDKSRVYFQNELGIPDTVFLQHGLKPIPQDRKLNVGSGDVIVTFSNRDFRGQPSSNIQFLYKFGSLGAQGYEIKIHKCLLMRYFVYIHKWVS